jgi:hypothetical protein
VGGDAVEVGVWLRGSVDKRRHETGIAVLAILPLVTCLRGSHGPGRVAIAMIDASCRSLDS